MSFWRNENKIQLKQTQVSIPSTNGLTYTATAGSTGRRVDFEIPPTVKFMDGKNSYLQFDLKIGLPASGRTTRLQLDPFIGGNAVVKNIRVYSGSRAVLLEEITDYNVKVGVQYSYNQDESLRKMRALKEGCLVPTIQNAGTLGTSVSNLIDLETNPYYKTDPAPAGRNYNDTDYLTAKLSLPIHCGIFSDSDKVFPVMMTQGLYVEIDLEDPAKVLCQLDSVNRFRRVQQNPLFHGNTSGGGTIALGASGQTEIFLAKDNNINSVEQCPFVKGEHIGFCKKDNINSQPNTVNAADADAPFFPTITDIEFENGYVKLTVGAFTNSSATGDGVAITSNDFVVYSAAIDRRRVQVDDETTVIIPAATEYRATYQISNVQLVLQQVELDPRYEAGMVQKLKDGGSIELDIHSATNYKHSLLKTNRNATVNLAVSNTRAKSCIVVPTDANVLNSAQTIGGLHLTYQEEETTDMDLKLHSIRSGLCGIIDELTSYQFVIDDKLVPSRPIVVSKLNKGVSVAAQPLLETEKALNQAKIVPRSFADYNRNFVIGRAYALSDGVMNLNNKSNQLQLFYNESTVGGSDRPPLHDKLLMAFIFHIRRITIKGDSIVVTV